MIHIKDPGHLYLVDNIDGKGQQEIRFVKREGEGFPGNIGHYEGTTLQHVLRVCLDRFTYLQHQIPCDENINAIRDLRNILYLLEHRAARRHGKSAEDLTQFIASFGPMCTKCGHTICSC